MTASKNGNPDRLCKLGGPPVKACPCMGCLSYFHATRLKLDQRWNNRSEKS